MDSKKRPSDLEIRCQSISRKECTFSTLTKLALVIYNKTYFRIPALLLDISCKNYSCALYVKEQTAKSKCIGLCNIIILLLTPLCIGLLLIKKLFTPDDTDINIGQIISSILSAACCILIMFLASSCHSNWDSSSCLNQMISNNPPFCSNQTSTTRDIPGLMLFSTICMICFGGTTFPIVLSFIGLNPFLIIVQNSGILPDPTVWNFFQIITHLLTTVLLEWLALIIFKYLFVSILVATLFTSSAQTYLKTLMHETGPNTRSLDKYKVIRLATQKCCQFIRETVLYLVSWSIVFLTSHAWFCLNCFQKFPTSFIFISFCCFVTGLCVTLFLLQTASRCRILSAEIIREKRVESFVHDRTRPKYLDYASWKAQQELSITCGRHFNLGKETLLNYITVLNENITNAILLIR